MLIMTAASGDTHLKMLDIMKPTVIYYAKKHGMDCLILPIKNRPYRQRPPAWDKILLINSALKHYKLVMWIDADAIIVDPTRNIRKVLRSDVPLHLVFHRRTPNTGMMVFRRSKKAFELLEAIWNRTAYINHPWWEQAALMDVLGYDPNDQNCRFRGKTKYTHMVKYLGWEWNAKPWENVKNPVIRHYLGPKRIDAMRRDYRTFLQRIK